ncbi:hypothetical protein [Paraburkholderia sp. Cpub6]|uniref:hypothetical protein n=1 Tax=Paraburkholderia sp. Cpub6 TaxID=2723094 RepID=UPI0016131FE2|nr:hypothetical protein [Paraburkholderia sp. Cpub6]MBB5461060.1 hypothetical protein [Paraburkholderia sp. Cpub6]
MLVLVVIRAVSPEQTDDFAGRDRQVDAIDGSQRAEAAHQPARFDHGIRFGRHGLRSVGFVCRRALFAWRDTLLVLAACIAWPRSFHAFDVMAGGAEAAFNVHCDASGGRPVECRRLFVRKGQCHGLNATRRAPPASRLRIEPRHVAAQADDVSLPAARVVPEQMVTHGCGEGSPVEGRFEQPSRPQAECMKRVGPELVDGQIRAQLLKQWLVFKKRILLDQFADGCRGGCRFVEPNDQLHHAPQMKQQGAPFESVFHDSRSL